MKPRRPLRRRWDINVTPLIDVLLVLLVIFMVITPLSPEGLDATIRHPQATGSQSASSSGAIVISMNAAGIIRINQEAVEAVDLGSRLADIFRSRSDRTFFLNADPSLLFQEAARIIDIARGAGASTVGLLTEPIE